jgi:hypothetical protein
MYTLNSPFLKLILNETFLISFMNLFFVDSCIFLISIY